MNDTELGAAMRKLARQAMDSEAESSKSLLEENKALINENYDLKRAIREILSRHTRPHPSGCKTHVWVGETGSAIVEFYRKLAGLESKDFKTSLVA